ERELGAQARAQVAASGRLGLPAAVEGIRWVVLGQAAVVEAQVLGLVRGVRRHLELAAGLDAVEPRELRKARDETLLAAWRVHDGVRLVVARDRSLEVDAPHHRAHGVEAHLRERDPQLASPALVVGMRTGL